MRPQPHNLLLDVALLCQHRGLGQQPLLARPERPASAQPIRCAAAQTAPPAPRSAAPPSPLRTRVSRSIDAFSSAASEAPSCARTSFSLSTSGPTCDSTAASSPARSSAACTALGGHHAWDAQHRIQVRLIRQPIRLRRLAIRLHISAQQAARSTESLRSLRRSSCSVTSICPRRRRSFKHSPYLVFERIAERTAAGG